MGKLGNRIKKARIALDITQEDLAKKIGVARATIASWEVGRRDPDTDTLYKISNICGVSIDWLLGKELPDEIDLVDALENSKTKITAAGRPLTPEERVKILEIIDRRQISDLPKKVIDIHSRQLDKPPGNLSDKKGKIDLTEGVVAANNFEAEIGKKISPELKKIVRDVILEVLEEKRKEKE